VSLNLHRRHLNESQRAMVAAKIATAPEGNPHREAKKLTASIDAVTQPEAAALLNVSRPSVQRAAAVREQGAPELVAAVEKGEVSVSAAAEVVDLPHEEQRELVKSGRKGLRLAAGLARADCQAQARTPARESAAISGFTG
jgi:DNA-binding transcriptional regulator YdaS (Cro superfamily)